MMHMNEKNHRLPRELYRGKISVAFTLCIRNRQNAFIEPEIVSIFTDALNSAVEKTRCIVPVYCFMPDHQHLIISGTSDESDCMKAVIGYKQKTGYWLSLNRPDIKWQKDFYDHIIRSDEKLGVHVRYILDNPVRKGLETNWRDHPFKGLIGCSLENVLSAII